MSFKKTSKEPAVEGKLSQTQPQGRWGSLAWWAEEKTGLLDPKGGLTLSKAMG